VPDLRLTDDHSVSKLSAVGLGQPTRPTQIAMPLELVNEE